jgi:hypothetical protein
MLSHYPIHVQPDRSITQRDYQGWPPLEYQQLSSSASASTSTHQVSDRHWITSCYDDWGQQAQRMPTGFIYHDASKRLTIHPWHY